jgi:predicted O-linked N-acetylglucosamine transferase (SPINDLY family)
VAAKPLWSSESCRHERIRIAYLSADFHLHATSQLMAELFERHDRERFEVSAWSFGPETGDAMRARLRAAFEIFHDVRDVSDDDVAARLRATGIDIAVDLKGYSKDGRPGIFARRVAPIQVNYLGYPGTTGADCMDYIIGDAEVIPEGHEAYYSEQVVRLPDSYQVNDTKRLIADRTPTRAEAGLPASGFVFCCFNNNYKITPEVFDVWMRLLKAVPGSVLWLLEDNAAASRNLRREAGARGVDAERLVFAGRVLPPAHLARQRLADLFLDTLPCNAHTTASDALWAGLPLLTCRGNAFAGRVAGSLLRAVGLPELITDDLGTYEALALRLATTPGELSALKARLSQNRLTHPLFDIDRYRRHLESAYVTMAEQHRQGKLPQAFSVQALS